MDGSPNTLECIAHDVLQVARKKRCLTAFKTNPELHFSTIMEGVVELPYWKNWLFIDSTRNASFVSHSAIFVPKLGILEHHYGLFDGVVKTVKI